MIKTTGEQLKLQFALYVKHFCRIPIPLCKLLGRTTAKYRWFALAYLIVMFGVLPAFVMVISLEEIVFACVMIPLILILIFVIVVNFIQSKPRLKGYLPKTLRDWEWLPRWAHSLGYWDRKLGRCKCCDKYRQPYDDEEDDENMEEGKKGDVDDSDSEASSGVKKVVESDSEAKAAPDGEANAAYEERED